MAVAPIPNADIHAVLLFVVLWMLAAAHTQIINNEGFQSLVDFGVLDDDKDILEMVKHLGSHKEVADHVYVGTIQVKKLQVHCYWVCDHQKCRQVIDHNNKDEDLMQAMIEMMTMSIEREQDTGNVLVQDLGKFDPDDFETHALDDIYKLVSSNVWVKQGKSIVPITFTNEAERHMIQLTLTGSTFDESYKVVYHLLKSFLVNTAGCD